MIKAKIVLPFLVIGIALAGVVTLIVTSPRIQPSQPEPVATAVRVITAEPGQVKLTVHSQGTIVPRTETALVPEISGTVVWMSPNLVSGGYFTKGEVLLRIDDVDYQDAVTRAAANVQRSGAENEHARFELERVRKLHDQKLLSQSDLETAVRSARVSAANLADSRVALKQAERDLARTAIMAPFTGLVSSEQVDIGQFISRGSPIANLYATDFVEIRLPIADQQLAYLNLPVTQRGELDKSIQAQVTVSANYAGMAVSWKGRLVRTEAEIDNMSRMVNVIARIESDAATNDMPPPVGLFVEAEIEGLTVNDVMILPRAALRDDDQVLIVDADNTIRFRPVDILRIYRDEVYISGGLQAGETVCISPLQTVISGMKVAPINEAPVEPEASVPLS